MAGNHNLVSLIQVFDGVKTSVMFFKLIPLGGSSNAMAHLSALIDAIGSEEKMNNFKKNLVSLVTDGANVSNK